MAAAEARAIRLDARRIEETLHVGDSRAACSGCSGCGWLPRQAQRLPACLLDEDSSQTIALEQGIRSDVMALNAQVDESGLARVVAVLFAVLLGALLAVVLLAEVLSMGALATVASVCAGITAIVTLFRQRRGQIEQAIALRLSLTE
ncbi:MAG: hypothetical protein NXH85_05785 [Pseudomonadaceae bacterium]|nr:hypothetical protein [Pseudomonadaceae bacterium]